MYNTDSRSENGLFEAFTEYGLLLALVAVLVLLLVALRGHQLHTLVQTFRAALEPAAHASG
jgi:Flp pilus assembly pilin Flp